MRKVLAIVLVALAIGQASSVMSAEPFGLASISGRAVDAAGRGVAGQRVDLMMGGQVLGASVTDTRGSWSFANVNPGEYVVRTSVNGTVAGTRVTVGTGQSVAGTLIVVPTSAISPQFGALASIVANMTVAAAATVTSVASSVASQTELTNLSEEVVAEIITALPPAERTAFAQQILTAVQSNPPDSGNIFTTVTVGDNGAPQQQNNFVQVLQQVVQNPTAPVITVTAS